MKRLEFIRNAATGVAGFATLSSLTDESRDKVTILHTNDTHSRIDPFPENHEKWANQGGIVGRQKMVRKIREVEEHVLLLDAGDIFQGTPYFNIYKGEVELKAMTAMKYDAATMGNHDFDAGLDGFSNALPNADFPFLCANYDFKDTLLKDKTIPNTTFTKGEIKIGVFGLGVRLDGLVPKFLYGDTQYLDPVSIAQEQADYLRNEENCNLVICLSHLGYIPRHSSMCDKVLVKETSNIDLIIGGHSHTFLNEPQIFKNKAGKPALVNQVGWAGLVLGRVDFYFDKKGKPDLWTSYLLSTNDGIC